jgi:hypothetical protein
MRRGKTRTLERMSRPLARLIGVGLLAFAGILLWQPVNDFLAVDRCLDAGGSYDYAKQVCDFNISHPIQSSRVTFWEGLGIVLVGLGIGTIWRSFSRHAL